MLTQASICRVVPVGCASRSILKLLLKPHKSFNFEWKILPPPASLEQHSAADGASIFVYFRLIAAGQFITLYTQYGTRVYFSSTPTQ